MSYLNTCSEIIDSTFFLRINHYLFNKKYINVLNILTLKDKKIFIREYWKELWFFLQESNLNDYVGNYGCEDKSDLDKETFVAFVNWLEIIFINIELGFILRKTFTGDIFRK